MLKRILVVSILAIAIVALGAAISPTLAHQSNLVKASFMNAGVQPMAAARIFVFDTRPQDFFILGVRRLTPGTYDLALNGAIVDTLTVRANGFGRIVRKLSTSMSNGHGHFPVAGYDPRGGHLDIQLQGVIILSADVPASPSDPHQKIKIETDLTNLGVVPGDADAEFRARHGRMKFEVELDHVASGSYDLLVGGTKVATIVVEPGDDDEEVEFDTRPSSGDDEDEDDEMDLLLTFDPRGQEIIIQQNGVNLFSATFPLVP